ncbi:hypothetical protein EHS25_002830 [Saitozyma podzolica]|uniref:Uncharacterized protein n=1 Tax=Saitozyma podzolica TaxID=1890683 RepID=A0A427YC19_9TREE|nr:hypothetical protein EHS25_002830 [Saitozyma podzolica]
MSISPNSSPAMRPISAMHLKTASAPGSGSVTPLHLAQLPSGGATTLPTSCVAAAVAASAGVAGGSGTGPGSGLSCPGGASRSYARAPTQRPYQSPLVARGATLLGNALRDVDGDTKKFGDLVANLVERRALLTRGGDALAHVDERIGARSAGGSLGGSWETERAELIVDIPVWSPGCFQDLSTLHALRDTTLCHTHALLAYLLREHSIPASYRLLARSAIGSGSSPSPHGWGCIRLAPTVTTSPVVPKVELKPKYRRTSFVYEGEREKRATTAHIENRPVTGVAGLGLVPTHDIPSIGETMAKPKPKRTQVDRAHGNVTRTPEWTFEHALADESDEEDEDVHVSLKEGYRSGSASDDEDEEECADVIVARELDRRGAKEGSAFLMTLFGGPALILT